jgi:hypothetical protein
MELRVVEEERGGREKEKITGDWIKLHSHNS